MTSSKSVVPEPKKLKLKRVAQSPKTGTIRVVPDNVRLITPVVRKPEYSYHGIASIIPPSLEFLVRLALWFTSNYRIVKK